MTHERVSPDNARVLLLVTTESYRAGAFLDAARRIGVAAVVGSDRAQALASHHPDGHLTLDFHAPERAAEMIAAFAARVPLAAVVAADDDGVVLGAMAAERLGLRHHAVEAVRTASHKGWARQALERAGLPGPRVRSFATDADPVTAAAAARYPCVLKPLVLSASRGVIRADDPVSFVAAFRRIAGLLARPDVARAGDGLGAPEAARTILVEDFLAGPEVVLEGLVEAGTLRPLALFDKPDAMDGPFFEETIYVTPSRLDAPRQAAVCEQTARAVRALGLAEGPVHAELRVGGAEPQVLEIAPRSIGGLCSRALRFDGGVSLEQLILMRALGHDTRGIERESAASGVMMIPIPSAGVLRSIEGRERALAVAGIEEARFTIPLGAAVVPLPDGASYLGFLFARAGTAEAVEAALREAHGRLRIEMEPGAGAQGARATPYASAATGEAG